MLDRLSLTLKAGNGGRGSTALWHGKRPYGGDGGDGGNVYIQGTTNLFSFSSLASERTYKAEDGQEGLPLNKFGGDGKDFTLLVPLTTEVYIDGELRVTIEKDGQRELLLKGGKGSVGNLSIKKHPHWRMRTDEERKGEIAQVDLVLKLESDIIFIGYPNAGKSSLLNKLTNAKAKVGAYEFTTLEPQTGRMDGIILMDLPGIIDNTHKGKGLGTSFTQHTEKTKLIAHIISLENESTFDTYTKMRKELLLIDPTFGSKKEVVVLTKSDEVSQDKLESELRIFSKKKLTAVACSILDDASTEKVKQIFKKEVLLD